MAKSKNDDRDEVLSEVTGASISIVPLWHTYQWSVWGSARMMLTETRVIEKTKFFVSELGQQAQQHRQVIRQLMFLTQIEWRFGLPKIRQKHPPFIVFAKQVIANVERAYGTQIKSARVEFLKIRKRKRDDGFAEAGESVRAFGYFAGNQFATRLD